MTTVFRSQRQLSDEEIRVVAGNWGLYLFSGILSVILGLLILSIDWSLYALSIFIGVYLVVWGMFQLLGAAQVRGPRALYIVLGVLTTVAGIVVIAWPEPTLFILAIFIGWWLVISGIFDIVASLMNTHVDYWWLYLIRGIVAVPLGIWALGHPGLTLVVLIVVVGIGAILYGVMEIFAAFQLKAMKDGLNGGGGPKPAVA